MRVGIAVLFVTLGWLPADAQNRVGDDTAIRARAAAFQDAVNARDAAALVRQYTSDADVIIVDGPLVNGRDAIRRSAESEWAKAPPNRRIQITVNRIRFLNADVALVNTTARFNVGPVIEDRGAWILVRQGQDWLVSALRVLPAAKNQAAQR